MWADAWTLVEAGWLMSWILAAIITGTTGVWLYERAESRRTARHATNLTAAVAREQTCRPHVRRHRPNRTVRSR